MEFEEVKDEILLVGKCIDHIDENINEKTSEIIKKVGKKYGISRTQLDNKFKKICIYEDGSKDTSSSYINGRKIQLGLKQGDKLKEARVKFDIKGTLKLAEKMNCIQKYGFGTVEIDPENYKKYTYDLDYKKILDFTFKDSLLIYPNLKEDHSPKNILEYNKSAIDECDFNHFYQEEIILNDVKYYITDRSWLYNMCIGGVESSIKLLELINDYIYYDLSRYNTLINKTKDYLGTHFYIKAAVDIKHLKRNPSSVVFNEILDIERGISKNKYLIDTYLKYEKEGIFESYDHFKYTVGSLLLDGHIYIN